MKIVAAMFLFAAAACGQAKMSDLDGLAGCWERRDEAKQVFFSEQWMKPAGGAMLGMGRTVRDGKHTDSEYMRIEQRADGIYLVARPKINTSDTDFKMISAKPGEFVFENPTHDFPQRVIYRFSGDTMTGRIEGKMNGKERAIDFPFKRVACE